MVHLVCALVIGALLGAFTAWVIVEPRLDGWRNYRIWYETLKFIIEDHYHGRVDENMKTGDCGVAFYPSEEKNQGETGQ